MVEQREAIRPEFLREGKNVIRFTAPTDKNYQYLVKNISLCVEDNPDAGERRLVVNQPTTAYYYKTFGYLQGFVEGHGSSAAVVTINSKKSKTINGIFEDVVAKPDNTEESWTAVVEAKFADGQVLRTSVKFDKAVEWDIYNGFDKNLYQAESFVKAYTPFEVKLRGASIKSDSCTLAADANISITALRDIDFPPLESGMVNVTGGHDGYRFLPHGTKFDRIVQIGIPYDVCLIPAGYSPKDIVTYYFDETRNHWIALPNVAVDSESQVILSQTNHFTDFINTIIKTPESPITQADVPTSLKDIKAANPLEGMTVIAPPTANNMGTANLSYPINIPTGRHGMQPNLALQYNSAGGNGWLGLGWDISVPAITVETRWGVPLYDVSRESETYVMGGDQLLTGDEFGKRDTLTFRALFKPRNTADSALYYPRVEGSFNKITRFKHTRQTYYWRVIDRNGSISYYGKSFTSNNVDNLKVLKDDAGNIAYWALSETVDPYGNWVRYTYDTVHDAGLTGSTLMGRQIYLKSICYTGHGTEDGKYTVSFNRISKSFQRRPDITISARYGFKEVTAAQLQSISVVYHTPASEADTIKEIYFAYNIGEFNKTLLCGFAEADYHELLNSYALKAIIDEHCQSLSSQNIAKMHLFDYYDDVFTGYNGSRFKSSVTIDVGDHNLYWNTIVHQEVTAIGGTQSKELGIGGALSVGLGSKTTSKNFTVGGNYHYNVSKSKGVSTLIDLNGDGLPDKVYADNNKLHYCQQILNPDGSFTFDQDTILFGRDNFLSEESKTNTWGGELQVGAGEASASGSYSVANTKSNTSVYFADVNADGLIDIVDNGVVYYNSFDINKNPRFDKPTGDIVTMGDGSCGYTTYAGSVNDSVLWHDPRVDTALGEPRRMFDAVRVWVAPYSGTVSINANIQLIEDTGQARLNSQSVDGVVCRIQHDSADIWKDSITDPDSYGVKIVNKDNQYLAKGSRLYFRLQSRNDRTFDRVIWNPTITYNYSSVYDPDEKNIYRFNAKEDFLVSGSQKYFSPVDGRIKIVGTISIPHSLSDEVTIKIIKNGSTNVLSKHYSGIFPVSENILDSFNILTGDSLEFRIEANTNVDWNAIKFSPHLYYTLVPSSYAPATNQDGTYKFELYPVFNYTTFPRPIRKTTPIVVSQSSYLAVTPNLTFTGSSQSGTIEFAVKKKNSTKIKETLTVTNNILAPSSPMVIQTNTGDTLYLEYYTDKPALAFAISTCGAFLNSSSPSWNSNPVSGLHSGASDTSLKFGAMYRGWGQFTYNNLNDSQYKAPMVEPKLRLPDPILSHIAITIDTTADTSFTAISNIISNIYDPLKHEFLVMEPNNQKSIYSGYGFKTSISDTTQNNIQVLADDVIFDENLVIQQPGDPTIKAVRKQNASQSNSYCVSLGAGTANVSKSGTTGESKLDLDFMDLNGDRYPDIVGSSMVQYSNSQGGLSKYCKNHGYQRVPAHKGTSYASGYTFGTSFLKIIKLCSNNPKSSKSSPFGDGTSVSWGKSNDNTEYTWMDINGDGLPDKVQRNGEVSLNLGYKFAAWEFWGNGVIRSGNGSNVGLSGSSNFSISNLSFNGGLGLSKSVNRVYDLLQDFNGDGLPDRIYFDNQAMRVSLNTGAGFASPITVSNQSHINTGQSFSESINGALTFGLSFPIPATPIIIKFCINPQFSGSQTFSHDSLQITDMNNDGFPDIIASSSPDNLTVMYSAIGRTNLLKDVKNYLGGRFDISYALSPCNQESSQRSWVMDSLKVYDGYQKDGPPYQLFTFEYDGAYFSRFERQSFGYEIVKTNQIAYDYPSVYRYTVEKFRTDNYLFKGLKKYELIASGGGQKYNETYYTYFLKEITSGNVIGNPNCFGFGYPAINQEDKYFYEGQVTQDTIHTRKRFVHGPYGNIITYFDDGDMASTDNDIETAVNYLTPSSYNNIISAVTSARLHQGNNDFRYREADYDPATGSPTEIRLYNGQVDASVYNLTYDNYGNLDSIVYPENINLERVHYSYTYDSVLHTYVTKIVDQFGYSSQSTYNYKFGKLTNATDIAGKQIAYHYDDRGRISSIQGPYERRLNVPYTIKFVYWDTLGVRKAIGRTDTIVWAKTFHYDEANPTNNIETVLFTDAQGKILQTKKNASICDANGQVSEKMVVSGQLSFDEFGRTTSTTYPSVENLGSEAIFYPVADNTQITTNTYDILDRELVMILPDGSTSTNTYSFGIDGFGNNCFLSSACDANEICIKSYTDAEGRKTTIRTPYNYQTKFEYDPIGQLTYSTDPDTVQTSYYYDKLGRTILREHPDAGATASTYDKAGNLLTLQTENLMSQNLKINYEYDHNRMMSISYPNNPENNVLYEYGDTGSMAGRVWKQLDASGVQEFRYGLLGEIIANFHTFASPLGGIFTFATRTDYDTWNRVKCITYPDKEDVCYFYDNGGLLKHMTGSKEGQARTYIDSIKYDKFGSRVAITMGNGTKTSYEYDVYRHRLKSLVARNAGGNPMMSNTYTYDSVGNIMGINNISPGYNAIGGATEQSFIYDSLYRLVTADGSFAGNSGENDSYQLAMKYYDSGKIRMKTQSHIRNNVPQTNTSYDLVYDYNSLPHAPSGTNAGDKFLYDHNGNLIFSEEPELNKVHLLSWNENNQLSLVFDNSNMSNFLYEGPGERYMKINSDYTQMTINGQGWQGFVSDRQTLYVNPYLVVNNTGYTKHYYADNQRVISKIGGGFTIYCSPLDTAYSVYGLGILNQADYNDKSNAVLGMLVNDINSVIPIDGLMGTHKLLEDSLTNGTQEHSQPETEIYYYHPDHLGSSNYITDVYGYPSQHLEYLPFGETFVEENIRNFDTPYKFNAKELDAETGYYYYGARYYDPRTSVWLGVDQLSDNYPDWSPYTYCRNNPVIRIDPTGRNDELVITGPEADQALAQLQAKTNLTLVRDPKTGKVDATGTIKSDNDKLISEIVNSPTVTVNVTANNSDQITSPGVANGVSYNGGAFLGNNVSTEKISDGLILRNDPFKPLDFSNTVNFVSTFQEVNPRKLGALDSEFGKSGQSMLHEISESYIGGIISQKSGISAGPKFRNTANPIFDQAHQTARRQPGAGIVTQDFFDALRLKK